MTLFELAQHPEAFEQRDSCGLQYQYWWGYDQNTTLKQFSMLNGSYSEDDNSPDYHTDENEFRMHLLFVHWATL